MHNFYLVRIYYRRSVFVQHLIYRKMKCKQGINRGLLHLHSLHKDLIQSSSNKSGTQRRLRQADDTIQSDRPGLTGFFAAIENINPQFLPASIR